MKKILILLSAAACLFLLSGAAYADDKKTEGKKPEAPEYMVILAKGHDAYRLRDYDKALNLYREAADLAPKNAKPLYFIGCAHRALKNYEEAVGAFETAYLLSTGDDWWKAMASFNIAMTYEAAGKLTEAKKSWQDFQKFASGKSALSILAATAEKRIDAIDKYIELDKKYEAVRDRIAKGMPE